PGIIVQHAENPSDALRAALRLAGGEPVLFLYEKLALARDALVAVGAQPWPQAEAGSPGVVDDSLVDSAAQCGSQARDGSADYGTLVSLAQPPKA
ncbi:MAG: hypothetical protein J2P29_17710, partial [Actinobacteria bacterium]|nr:hypothetical protein [Actinomycetota bacterium]